MIVFVTNPKHILLSSESKLRKGSKANEGKWSKSAMKNLKRKRHLASRSCEPPKWSKMQYRHLLFFFLKKERIQIFACLQEYIFFPVDGLIHFRIAMTSFYKSVPCDVTPGVDLSNIPEMFFFFFFRLRSFPTGHKHLFRS